jgi:tRNA(fMet)-specific endonuclease VapC
MAVLTTSPSALAYLLDSNVVSELSRRRPNEAVVRRFQAHLAELALPTPAWHEVQFGCLRLPEGERRRVLQDFLARVVATLPQLAYDAPAALLHARWRAQSEARGRVLPLLDAQIAAIASTQGLTLVTRNTRDFEGLPGLRLANWFED